MAEEEKVKLLVSLQATLHKLQAQLQTDGWDALYEELRNDILTKSVSIVGIHLTTCIKSLVQARQTQVTHLRQTIAFIEQHPAATLTFEHIIRLRESLVEKEALC